MADIEKAIKGLEWILNDDRFGFGKGLTKPETDEEQAGCYIHDALELLKEQQNRIDVLRSEVKRLDVDIVRCKDCKKRGNPVVCILDRDLQEYGGHRTAEYDDWFCKDGEPNENEDDDT